MTASILATSVRAVATLVVMGLGGVFLNRKGVMTPQVSKGLSEVSMSLTIPCLLFTTAIDCTQDHSKNHCPRLGSLLHQGWPMLLLPGVYVGVGLFVGAAAARIGKAEDNFRRSAIAAVAFGNSTGLPVTLLAIIHMQAGPDTDLGMLNPVLFLSVYLVLYPVLQWSVGSWLLQPLQRDARAGGISPDTRASVLKLLLTAEPPLGTLCPAGWQVVRQPPCHGTRTFHSVEAPRAEAEDRPASWHSHLASPVASESPTIAPRSPPLVEEGPSRRARALTIAQRVFPPPVLAALLGMLVALVEPVRGLLVDVMDRDGDAPLEWLFNGLAKIGAAAVPINMLILGNSVAKGAGGSISIRTALAVAAAKMVVMPIIGLGLALAMKAIALVPEGPDDAFYLVTMIVSATPTANNIMVMAELAGENKEGLGTCIFVQYMLCPIILTFWLTIFVAVATSRSEPASLLA